MNTSTPSLPPSPPRPARRNYYGAPPIEIPVLVLPFVGMGATLGVGSDRYAYTVSAVSPSGKTLTLTRDTVSADPSSDYYGKQVYHYAPGGERAGTIVARASRNQLSRNGSAPFYADGRRVSLGLRNEYSDPSF